MKKAWALGLAALLVLTMFAGCRGKDDTYAPETSGIYLREDGSVVSADIEEFAQSYYDKAELQAFVEDEVTAYNREKAGLSYAYAEDAKAADKNNVLPVSIAGLETGEKKASLYLEYATCRDYLDFNGEANAVLTALSQTTVKEAAETGTSFAGLKDTEGAAADEAKIRKKKKYACLTLTVAEGQEESLSLQVQGSVRYVSSNVTITGENTVTVPAGETAVIIYK